MDSELENIHYAMVDDLDCMLRQKDKVTERFKTYLKDIRIPLDQRWDLFKWHGSLLDISSTKLEFSNLQDKIRIYEGYLNTMIRQNKLYFGMLIYFIESLPDKCPKEDIDNLKEEILTTGYKGYRI